MIWGLSSPSRVVQKRQDSRSSEEVAAWGSGGNLDALGSSPGHGTVSPAHPPTHLPPAKRGAATHTPALWVAHSGMFLGNPLRGASARGPTWDDVHRNSYTNGARARAPTGTEGTVAAAAHTYARTLGRPQTLEASRGVRTAHIPVPRQSTGPIHRLPSPHPCPPPPSANTNTHTHTHKRARWHALPRARRLWGVRSLRPRRGPLPVPGNGHARAPLPVAGPGVARAPHSAFCGRPRCRRRASREPE